MPIIPLPSSRENLHYKRSSGTYPWRKSPLSVCSPQPSNRIPGLPPACDGTSTMERVGTLAVPQRKQWTGEAARIARAGCCQQKGLHVRLVTDILRSWHPCAHWRTIWKTLLPFDVFAKNLLICWIGGFTKALQGASFYNMATI